MPMNSINHAAGSKSMGCIPKTNNHIKTNDSHSLIKPRKEHHKSQSKDHNSVSSKPKDRNHSASSSSHKHTSSGDRRHHGEHSKDKHHSSLSSGDKHKERHRQESSSKHHKSTLELLGSNKPKDMSRVKLPEGLVESSGLLDAIVGRSDDEKRREKRHKQKLSLDQKAKEKLKVKEEPLSKKIKKEPTESDDDIPLSVRVSDDKPVKSLLGASDDEQPLLARAETTKMVTEEIKQENKRKIDNYDSERPKKRVKMEPSDVCLSPTTGAKRKKKKEGEAPQVWKWWEEDRREDGVKWKFLEHKGPVFAPDYERLPPHIEFFYDGKKLKLSKDAEEIAGFYAKMLDHEYTTRNIFNKNFFNDWRKAMAPEEKKTIVDLKKCDFTKMHAYFQEQSEKRKNLTKEEKQIIKKNNEEIQNTYGYCIMDGHKEKIGNYKIEPPGLFRGRGDHPKQGKLKKRIMPEDVIINCSKDSNIPKPPKGHKWKEVRHDKKVTWLTCWTENVQGQNKYMMLNAASKLKGEKDWQKYEVARRLYKHVDRIRAQYREDWKSKEMRIRQRAVALYFIDKLALRAGNEKEEGESADTVGCCSLRVEHIILHNQCDGKQYVVEFDFLGKDSIRYQNRVPVEKRVYKNIQLFMDNKQPGDDLFDRLNTTTLNKHLHDLMEGLTAKVFRTFNASKTLQEQLDLLTKPEDPIPAKILSYNRANRAVAILCNHQRAVPKNFTKQMENLQLKIDAKKDSIKEAKKSVKEAKSELKNFKTEKAKCQYEKKKKQLERLLEQLTKLEVQATDKDENKEIALGTSKLNYLDPRITIAWCKKWEVPIEKIYNKTQRDKFRWAIDMATGSFKF